MTDAHPDPADPAVAFQQGWSLDMLAPLDAEGEALGGDLLGRWRDLSVIDLPPVVQAVALSKASWRIVVNALAESTALGEACESFVAGLRRRLEHRYDARTAAIALARAGLLSNDIPTFAALAQEWDVTRARVQQLDRPLGDLARTELDWRAHLRLVIAAHFAVRPGVPLDATDMADARSPRGRAVRLALKTLNVPKVRIGPDLWTRTLAEERAITAIADEFEELLPRARSFEELETVVDERLPGVVNVLDMQPTLRVLARVLDFGPGLDGRFQINYASLVERVARKVRTYLQRRDAAIPASELADAVRRGVPPFEPLHRPLVEAEWLTQCARRSPHLLQVIEDGQIALAGHLAETGPTGNVAILHSIVAEHGEPMRMFDLCDRAGEYGISRNQVGVFIHSGRAASLFMLERGIVGLVGRDEVADATKYRAATAHETPRARLGTTIGLDDDGNIAADVIVRRSVREQGFGLPWPLSIFYFSDHQRLRINDEPREINVRANRELDLPELEPGSTVRLRLKVTKTGHRLLIENEAPDTLHFVAERPGDFVSPGLPSAGDRPGWVNNVLANCGIRPKPLDDVLALLPRSMTDSRRLRGLFALIALGLLEPRPSGWRARAERSLPSTLARVFAALEQDSSVYPLMTGEEQAAAAWLARGTWVVPSLGWSRVVPNDLNKHESEDDDTEGASTPPSERETALMRIAEAAHQAEDMRRHPGSTNGLDATATVVRRYLIALGFTTYDAVKELDGEHNGVRGLRACRGDDTASVWTLKPIGSGVGPADLDCARAIACSYPSAVAVATDGLILVVDDEPGPHRLDLRKVTRSEIEFHRLATLAAQPSSLESDSESPDPMKHPPT